MPAKKSANKVTKKTTASKVPAKKVATKAPVKKVAARKAVAKKAVAKKAVAPKVAPIETTIIAKVDVGFGNQLALRGEGAGLSWEKGEVMSCQNGDEWTWSTTKATSGIVFKFLLNDEVWMQGDDLTVAAGSTSVSAPRF